jgi:hypothetical protein
LPGSRAAGDEEWLALSRASRRAAWRLALAALGWWGSVRAQSAEPAISSETPSLAELEGEPVGTTEPSLPAVETLGGLALYGFADFGFYKYFLSPGSLIRAQLFDDSAFMVGNLNTYLSGELGGSWRSLMEIRYTYLPNGSRLITGSGIERVSTAAADYTNSGRVRDTGSIFIERAWVEYSASAAFNLRAGSWLTPYGIWNEDHGSPTIIPVTRPYVIGLELLPERQTGLLLFGSFYASESVTLRYQMGLSNGRGPLQDYADLDENKAVTLRLQCHHHGAGDLDLGATAYLGRYTDLEQLIRANGSSLVVDERLRQSYDEASWALDARYVQGGLHLQAEFIVNERAYREGGRPARSATQFQPDDRRYGGYVLTGYRFDWLGVMPYATAEYFSPLNTFEPTRPATQDVFGDFGLGINSRPATNITLKLEGNLGVFDVENSKGSAFEHPLLAIQAQVAWAF